MYASTSQPPFADAVCNVFNRMPSRNAVSWNIMIGWYAKWELRVEALEMFMQMMENGIRPTPVSFVNVFPAITNQGLADALYGLLVKFGGIYVDDLFVVSSVISAYSEMSDLQTARQVFDCATEKNIEVWNTMFSGYVQNGHCNEGLALFRLVLGSDLVSADAVTFLTALMAVSQLQHVRLGQQVHGYLLKRNLRTSAVILWNALLVMYSRCGYVKLAFELFHRMRDRDVVSWNTMISAFIQNGLDFEGILLVHEMQKEGFSADSVTVLALLSAASNLAGLNIGRETHSYLIRHGIQFEGMRSYLIDMYSKSGLVEIAWKIFDCDQSEGRDQVTWNAMIAGYVQNRQNEQAMSIFCEMLEDHEPNSVTLASVLPTCNQVGGIKTGKEIHGFVVRRCLDNNVFVGTALVDMYSKRGDILSAERVFDRMLDKTTVSYTTMLAGFGQHGLGRRALSLFQSMKESGLEPDDVTFVAMISACSYSGLVEEGLSVFRSMDKLGVLATFEHHCCVVDMLGRAGRLQEAYEFIQELGDCGNFVGIWGSLLAACKVHGNLEMAKLVSERLFQIEEGNKAAGYHVLLSNAYAAEGKWVLVDRVREKMREKGLRKEPGLSWIDLGDSAHKFMSRDQNHPEHDQVYAMLEELAAEMKLASHKRLDVNLEDGDFDVDE